MKLCIHVQLIYYLGGRGGGFTSENFEIKISSYEFMTRMCTYILEEVLGQDPKNQTVA